MGKAKEKLTSLVLKIVPGRFLKHYVQPFLPSRRKTSAYNPKQFFDSWYSTHLKDEFSDRITIKPGYDHLASEYYYNSVENAILEYFLGGKVKDNPQILDIGSGAGHWIKFYDRVFRPSTITGADISEVCVQALRDKFAEEEHIQFVNQDITSPDFSLDRKFDIINAIGVIFHIVEDELWMKGIANLGRHLNEGGVLIVSGQFGLTTQNVQFHKADTFASWDEFYDKTEETVLYNKRIRSLRHWKQCARSANLRVDRKIKARQHNKLLTIESNILALVPRV
jgi:SAM-dependent methyltransferase